MGDDKNANGEKGSTSATEALLVIPVSSGATRRPPLLQATLRRLLRRSSPSFGLLTTALTLLSAMDRAGPAPPAPSDSTSEPTPPPAKRPRNGSTDGDSGKGRVKGTKATSCRECIRLKLKCSREWPCTSCVRRKVASLCPDGELPHRDVFLQQETIKELLEQNKALTAALQQQQQQQQQQRSPLPQYAHTSLPVPPLPQQPAAPVSSSLQSLLLSPLAAATAPSPPFDRDSPDAPGNPLEAAAGRGPGVMETEGTAARFHGRGAGALFLIDAGTTDSPDLYPGELLFPFASAPATTAMLPPDQYPPYDAALGYINVYFTEVDWMYQPCARTFVDSDLRQLYSGPSNTANPCCLHPHRLATLLTIFALALTFSQNLEIASRRRNPQATAFFNAAAALLTSPPYNFMSRPTVAAVKCLHLMVSYLFCSGDREGARSAWTILGLASRAAQALGLHKNCAAWGLSADVTEERARAWWEIFVYDLLQSLNFGRPYAIPLHFISCPRPTPPATGVTDSAFHAVKYEISLMFAKIADLLAAPDLPDYAAVLQLDREFKATAAKAPHWLRLDETTSSASSTHPPSDIERKLIPQRHMLVLLLHKGLLALHRPWFAKALMSGTEPMTSPYAASFNACLISARRHTSLMRSVLEKAPRAAVTWWFYAFHTFTSAVIQSSVLLRAPYCMLNEDIRADFAQALQVFNDIEPYSALAGRALPILRKLKEALERGPNVGGECQVQQPAQVVHQANSTDSLSVLPAPPTYPPLPVDPSLNPSTAAFAPPPQQHYDVHNDPAGVLLSNLNTPMAWDSRALDFSSYDSIGETLLFWNPASALGPETNAWNLGGF
ncbi:putative transcriptional regulatory protein C1F7.11c [Rhodotorula toruloides]|nr:putative transcriptional regulatory protein C1F7.11c [Rhodotorula toruloides]